MENHTKKLKIDPYRPLVAWIRDARRRYYCWDVRTVLETGYGIFRNGFRSRSLRATLWQRNWRWFRPLAAMDDPNILRRRRKSAPAPLGR